MGNTFRHVLRGLRRSPMFTTVTLITIALAVGANAAIFSIINGVLLKPFPYREPDRLVSVRLSSPVIGLADMELSPSDYFVFREENQDQAEGFVSRHRDARRLHLAALPDDGMLLPNRNHDGFFYALFEKD